MRATGLGGRALLACALAAAACGRTSVAPQQIVDAGPTGGVPDAGTPAPDGGTPAPDAGTPAPDAGTPAPDAGTPAPDAGTPATDGGTTTSNDLTPAVPAGIQRLTSGEHGVALAADDQNVYWLSQLLDVQPGFDKVQVRAAPRTGGPARTLATVTGHPAQLLLADADSLYFDVSTCDTNPNDYFPCSLSMGGGGHAGYRVPKSGGAATALKGFHFLLAVDADHLYFSRQGYDFDPGNVEMAAKDGTGIVNIDEQYSPALVATGTDLYWLSYGKSGPLIRHRARGGTANDDIGNFGNNLAFGQLAFDGQTFFLRGGDFRRPGPVGIYGMPRAGGTPQLLWATPQTLLAMVEGAAGHVFWNQDPSPLDGFAGCAGAANADGTNGRCIDMGHYRYGPVKASGPDLFYLRDGDVFRAPIDAPADTDGSDGEWLERGNAVPSAQVPGSFEGVLAANDTFGTLAIDADNVYWAHADSRGTYESVMAVSKEGGAPVAVASLPAGINHLIASAETDFIYFDAASNIAGTWNGLRRTPKSGGPIEWLGAPFNPFVNGGFIYFGGFGSTIDRVDLAGHGRTTVGRPPYFTGFTVSQGEIIWMEDRSIPTSGGTIRAAPADGSGAPRTITGTDGGSNFGGMVADATTVYWIRSLILYTAPRAGGPINSLGHANDFSLDVNGGRVYWTERTSNDSKSPRCVWGSNPDGTNRVCIDSSTETYGKLKVDDKFVYFVRGDSLVKKARK